jgi:uncharacterized protein YpmS
MFTSPPTEPPWISKDEAALKNWQDLLLCILALLVVVAIVFGVMECIHLLVSA